MRSRLPLFGIVLCLATGLPFGPCRLGAAADSAAATIAHPPDAIAQTAASPSERFTPTDRARGEMALAADVMSTDDLQTTLEHVREDHLSLFTARQPSEAHVRTLTSELSVVIQHLAAAQGRLLGSDAQLVNALYASERLLAQAQQLLDQARQTQRQLTQQVAELQATNQRLERRTQAQQQALTSLADANALAERKLQEMQRQLEAATARGQATPPEERRHIVAPPDDEASVAAAAQARSDVTQLTQQVEQLQQDRATLAQQLSQHEVRQLRLAAELGLARTEFALLQQRRPELEPARTAAPAVFMSTPRRASNRPQQAMALLAQRLADRDTSFNLALRHAQEQQWVGAAQDLEATLALDPEDAESHLVLALIARDHLRQVDRASQHYEAYRRLMSTDTMSTSPWLAQPPLPVWPALSARRIVAP